MWANFRLDFIGFGIKGFDKLPNQRKQVSERRFIAGLTSFQQGKTLIFDWENYPTKAQLFTTQLTMLITCTFTEYCKIVAPEFLVYTRLHCIAPACVWLDQLVHVARILPKERKPA
jgi:hypothetical protein